MRFNRRKTAGYRYLSILTQAGEILKSGLLFLVPIAPKEKTNLFLGKKLAIFVYITRYALVGWLLSQSVGLMLFTAFFTVNYYWLMVGAASSIRSKNKAKGDQKSFGFIVKLVRQLAGILKPTRVMNVMDAMALMASVAFVMEVASMSSVLSAFILGACFCGIVSAKVLYDFALRELIQGSVGHLEDYWWTAVVGSLFNCLMFYFGGTKLLSSVFRLNSVCHSPLREFSKAAVAVSFSSVMLNEISKTLDEKKPIRAPWVEAVD